MNESPEAAPDETGPPRRPPAGGRRSFADEAIGSIRGLLARLKLSEAERGTLGAELGELEDMLRKLEDGHVEITVFGEVSAGKSSLLNALLGRRAFEVGARHGVTQDRQRAEWRTAGFSMAGAGNSKLVLVDTPGINEVYGEARAELAARTVRYSDIVLFVIDGDLNEVEHSAMRELHALGKPILLAINKADTYSRQQLEEIHASVRERVAELVRPEDIVFVSADPMEREFVIAQADGRERSEWRKPRPQIEALELRILDVLAREGLAITALSASLFAAEVSPQVRDKIVAIRQDTARRVVGKYALIKAIAVGMNPLPVVDIVGGVAVDAQMIKAIGDVYGMRPSLKNSQGLMWEIGKAMGILGLAEVATHTVAGVLETLTLGLANVITAVPQAAIAGWSSYVIGQATSEYYRNEGSWGGEDAREVLRRIIDETDSQSILINLKDQVRGVLKARSRGT